jgi:hypothetical protein
MSYYAGLDGLKSTFWDYHSVPSSRIKLTLKDETDISPETSD